MTRKRRAVATVLSVVFCGLGQIYKGQMWEGLGLSSLYLASLAGGAFLVRKGLEMGTTESFYISAPAGEVVIIATILFFVAFFFWVYGVYDAYTNQHAPQSS